MDHQQGACEYSRRDKRKENAFLKVERYERTYTYLNVVEGEFIQHPVYDISIRVLFIHMYQSWGYRIVIADHFRSDYDHE